MSKGIIRRKKVSFAALAVLGILAAGTALILRLSTQAAGCTTTVSTLSAVQTAVNSASNGSTVCLADGVYGKLTLNSSKASPGVTIRAENPGQATIAGASVDGSWLTVAQFRMTGTFNVAPGSTGMTAYHNFIDMNAFSGFGVTACNSTTTTCNDVSIIGNRFVGLAEEDMIRANRYHDSNGDGNGLLIEQNEFVGNQEMGDHNDVFQSVWTGDHLVFRKNYLHDFGGQGFFVKDQTYADPQYGVVGPIDGFVADNNLIIRQNLPCIPDSLCTNFQLSPFQIYGGIKNGHMNNNTVWPTDVGQAKGGGTAVLTDSYTNIEFSNNVFDTIAVTGGAATVTTGSNNTHCSSNSWPVPTGSTQSCNPAFINQAAGDYRQANGRGVNWKAGDYTYGPETSINPPPSCTKVADINCDTKVDIFDLSIVLSNYGKTRAQASNPAADINNSDVIDGIDLSVLLSNYGT